MPLVFDIKKNDITILQCWMIDDKNVKPATKLMTKMRARLSEPSRNDLVDCTHCVIASWFFKQLLWFFCAYFYIRSSDDVRLCKHDKMCIKKNNSLKCKSANGFFSLNLISFSMQWNCVDQENCMELHGHILQTIIPMKNSQPTNRPSDGYNLSLQITRYFPRLQPQR